MIKRRILLRNKTSPRKKVIDKYITLQKQLNSITFEIKEEASN